MTKDEALDLALEALEQILSNDGGEGSKCYSAIRLYDARILGGKAITAIKQARSAPVQEPVETGDTLFRQFMSQAEKAGITHWPTPPAAQPAPVQEPVVFYRCNGCGHAYEQVHPTSCDCMEAGGFDRVEYYTTPPAAQRQWVSLTDEEILEVLCIHVEELDDPDEWAYEIQEIRAIEAKLRSKNGY